MITMLGKEMIHEKKKKRKKERKQMQYLKKFKKNKTQTLSFVFAIKF